MAEFHWCLCLFGLMCIVTGKARSGPAPGIAAMHRPRLLSMTSLWCN